MNVLTIGSGGREHAIGHSIAQSQTKHTQYFAPGNAGTAMLGTNAAIDIKDFSAIIQLCLSANIHMLIIGPEEPLVNGLYDAIKEHQATKHIHVIGPSAQAAQLEGSKSFAKSFMHKYNVPTAAYQEYSKHNFEAGIEYIKQHALPIVLKADGLAGGKGVIICNTHIEAIAEFEMMIKFSKFGEAGNKVVVEQFLQGMECSLFAITDGTSYKLLPIAKDYKRIGVGDTGLNTGGMGAISPVPAITDALYQKIVTTIVEPTIHGIHQEGMVYTGFVFIGLTIVGNEPYVIEYNCRLGDPETEVVLPRLHNDLVDVFAQLTTGNLNQVTIQVDPRCAATIVAASGGYPNYYNSGYIIKGLNTYNTQVSTVYISGAIQDNDKVVSNSGRVLAVTSYGTTIAQAVANSTATLSTVHFEDMYYRTDIGYEFIN